MNEFPSFWGLGKLPKRGMLFDPPVATGMIQK
jgi:hypothetical protein